MIKTCLGPTEFLQRDKKKNNRSYILYHLGQHLQSGKFNTVKGNIS